MINNLNNIKKFIYSLFSVLSILHMHAPYRLIVSHRLYTFCKIFFQYFDHSTCNRSFMIRSTMFKIFVLINVLTEKLVRCRSISVRKNIIEINKLIVQWWKLYQWIKRFIFVFTVHLSVRSFSQYSPPRSYEVIVPRLHVIH